ncbi:hypothetical protein H634G_03196 [Metarhizium anisopliae BRIP 53293]|uniref:Uncharacterized protein n=1 Tax=Metarhizium anisopliae BRIP 53293 TaxID=1291518 RepID=A0A0D9P6Z9_METAN|nr:hypothetical protein H634G_03196 [Metarhizium anisopliae BRIP 53293]KJK86777.1 hypothetical protein H633G_09383 [Metarhizium anisopliae BRIP 53284]
MEDQYVTPSVLSSVSDDDNESSMDTGDDENTPNTPGGSCQNEGGLQGYTSPQETSPDYEIQEEVVYHDESHQDQPPETPAPWQATAAIDDNFKHTSTLGKRVEWLNDEQAFLNEWQEHVHSEARQIVADAAKHASQDILPQLEKMKHELMESHQPLKKLTSPQLKNAVTRASQSPLGEDTEKDALQRHLSGALQALDIACKALHGIQTPAQECPCREMQPAASYEEQNNALTVPLSAYPDAAAIGNGRTNNSSLTGEFNNFNFNSADVGNNDMHNNMDTLLSSLHLPTANNVNGIMTSNTGLLLSPMQGGTTSSSPTSVF